MNNLYIKKSPEGFAYRTHDKKKHEYLFISGSDGFASAGQETAKWIYNKFCKDKHTKIIFTNEIPYEKIEK